jgi:NADH-quinone oxidoreductase subunit E
MGGESLMAHLAAALGIEPGETTADGMFTLLPCCCLGNCGEAPTLMIGDTLHGRVTPEKAGEILAAERRELSATEG